MAPTTSRSLRSPATVLKTSDTMRSHDTNMSSADSGRHQSRSTAVRPTTIIADVTPNDAYQQVYHDDSSTHGSRTLDSRFSRDKYDLSDGESTDDEDEDKQDKSNVQNQSNEQTEKPINGSSPQAITVIPHDNAADDNNNNNKPIIDFESSINSKRVIELDELDKSKSPGKCKKY